MNSEEELDNLQSNEDEDKNSKNYPQKISFPSNKFSNEGTFPTNYNKTNNSNSTNKKINSNELNNNSDLSKNKKSSNNMNNTSGNNLNYDNQDYAYQKNNQMNKKENRLNSNDINNNISEQEKINDDFIGDQDTKKSKKGRYNQNPMERISEVEGEDEKYTTIFDKMNEEAQKNEYRINEENYQDLIDKNITSENVKYLFHPTLFDTEESKNKFQPEINKNSRIIAEKERNKSSDTTRSKAMPIEVLRNLNIFSLNCIMML
jgi:hypothetical protein